MKEKINIILPIPPAILNPNYTIGTIGGRFAKAAAAKKMRQLSKKAVEEENISTIPWERVSIRATFYYSTKRKRDQDNAIGSLKAVYDGIVDSGLLVSDDYKHMRTNSPIFKVDKINPRVQLTITRIK